MRTLFHWVEAGTPAAKSVAALFLESYWNLVVQVQFCQNLHVHEVIYVF